ncbi:MAG: hydroxymethylbilane synthase [Myxococcota bacterium]
MTRIRVATRASELALWQARLIAGRIERELGVETELLPMKTTGDRLRGSLATVGGKGLFVKEIEEALIEGRADLAVHSAKDLPAVIPAGLALVAFPERADPRDALVARQRGASIASLPSGARVGTGSVRRGAQLRAARPDLEIVPLRGNLPTRLRKLESESLDAIVLACAGLDRLDLADRIDERIAPERMLPAVAQGALALEARAGDSLADDLKCLNDRLTADRVTAERAFLSALGGDCNTPLAALAEAGPNGSLVLRALLAATDGRRILRHRAEAPATDAQRLGSEAAAAIRESGGEELLAEMAPQGAS